MARDIIGAAGHADHFGHGLGHGVGLEVHEAPRLARSGDTALAAGNVVTVEPGDLPAGPRRRAHRGSRRRHRGRPRRAQRDDEGPRNRGLGSGPHSRQAAESADTGCDGTSSPHPHAAAPRRHHCRAGRAPRARRRGHGRRRKAQEAPAKLPVITKVTPMRAAIGDTLTIQGKNFRRGVNKNTVDLHARRRRGRSSSRRRSARPSCSGQAARRARRARSRSTSGVPVATRFRLRVLAAKFGRAFTTSKHSPIARPREGAEHRQAVRRRAPTPTATATASANRIDTDDDNDLLSDTLEAELKTDPCKADTDGDGVAGRLRVPLGAGPQRRRVPEPVDRAGQRRAALPGQAALPERARPVRRQQRLRRRRRSPSTRSTASGSTRSTSEGAPVRPRTTAHLLRRRRSTRSTPVTPTAAAARASRGRPTTSTTSSSAGRTPTATATCVLPVRGRTARGTTPTDPVDEQTFSIFDVNLDGETRRRAGPTTRRRRLRLRRRARRGRRRPVELRRDARRHDARATGAAATPARPTYLIKYAGTSLDRSGHGRRRRPRRRRRPGPRRLPEHHGAVARPPPRASSTARAPCNAPDPPQGAAAPYQKPPEPVRPGQPVQPVPPGHVVPDLHPSPRLRRTARPVQGGLELARAELARRTQAHAAPEARHPAGLGRCRPVRFPRHGQHIRTLRARRRRRQGPPRPRAAASSPAPSSSSSSPASASSGRRATTRTRSGAAC